LTVNNIFIRHYNDYLFFIENNEIIFSEKKAILNPIKKESYLSKDKHNLIENIKIGVLDLETYTNMNRVAKVYALGFLTFNSKPNLYYINKYTLNSNELIINCNVLCT